MIVCPASSTREQVGAGITDTLAVGLLVEAQGLGTPLVAVPYTNAAMAAHPAFRTGVARLREWGVTVLFGDQFFPLHPPGAGERHQQEFPWGRPLAAVRDRLCSSVG